MSKFEDLKQTIAEQEEDIDRLINEKANLIRRITDMQYMQEALVAMLEPNGRAVWDKWQQMGVQRVHYDFADNIKGEKRAKAILGVESAYKRVVDVKDIDK